MTQSETGDTQEVTEDVSEEGSPPPSGWLHSRRAKILVVAVAAVLLVLAIVIVPHFFSKGGGGDATDQPQLATAAIQTFPVTASANGTVVPASEVGVNFSTPGTLSAISVQVGQEVSKGTVLAQLDSTVAQSDVARAQAAVSSAQTVYNQSVSDQQTTAANDSAAVASDKQQLASDQQRLTTNGCSASQPSNTLVCQNDQAAVAGDGNQLRTDEARQQTDATSGQLSISQAQSTVTSASSQLQTAQDELSNLTLVAPNAGKVLQINGQIGENVSGSATSASTLPGTSAPIPSVAGATTAPGSQPFILIGDSDSYVVGTAFPSGDIPELSAGQAGTITDASLSGLSLPCHVLAVASTPVTVNGNSIVYASVTPDGDPSGLYSGQEVTVAIAVARATRVLAVPQSAVYLVSGVPHVDVWDGSHSIPTVVKTKLEGTTLIEVASGLSAGEQVVLSPAQSLPSSGSGNTP